MSCQEACFYLNSQIYTFSRIFSPNLGLSKAFAVTFFEVVKRPSGEGGLKLSPIVAAANNIQYQAGEQEKKYRLKAEGRVSAPQRLGGGAHSRLLECQNFISRYFTLYANLNFTERPVTNNRKQVKSWKGTWQAESFNLDWILYFGPDLNLKIMFFKERASVGVRLVPEQKYCCARYSLHLNFWRSEKCPTILMMIWYSFILFQPAKL